jgi:DMSO/TMAO reductase YedYZ heme-binding membrane subunit
MMDDSPLNLMVYTDSTKKTCMCSAFAIFLIVLFAISPLKYYLKTAMVMKLIAIVLIIYTIYVNYHQTNILRLASKNLNAQQLIPQLNINILCNYIFIIFIGLLCLFVMKSFI